MINMVSHKGPNVLLFTEMILGPRLSMHFLDKKIVFKEYAMNVNSFQLVDYYSKASPYTNLYYSRLAGPGVIDPLGTGSNFKPLNRLDSSQYVRSECTGFEKNSLVESKSDNVHLVFKVPEYGEFIGHFDLYVKLPRVQKTSGTFANWCNAVAIAMFESVSLEYNNGQVIFYSVDELISFMVHESEASGKSKYVGQRELIAQLQDDSTSDIELVFRIPFSFDSEFPFPNLVYTERGFPLTVRAVTRPFSKLFIYDGNTEPTVSPGSFDICMYTQLISKFTTLEERTELFHNPEKRFAQYMQRFDHAFEIYDQDDTLVHVDISMFKSTNRLYICAIGNDSLDNNDYFNFGNRQDASPIVKSIGLRVDSNWIYDVTPTEVLESRYNKESHTYFYVIDFSKTVSKKTSAGQVAIPGAFDFTVSKGSRLVLNIDPSSDGTVHVYSLGSNLLGLMPESELFSVIFEK